MSTSLIDNFSYRGRAFLDARQSVATLAALKAVPESELPDGFRAYCAEDKQWYEFNTSNTSDAVTGKWRAIRTEVAQEPGDRTDIPMSQKAVTEAITATITDALTDDENTAPSNKAVKETIYPMYVLDKEDQCETGFWNIAGYTVDDTLKNIPSKGEHHDFACVKLTLLKGDVLEIYARGSSGSSRLYCVINEDNIVEEIANPGEDTRTTPKVIAATEKLEVYCSFYKNDFKIVLKGFAFSPERYTDDNTYRYLGWLSGVSELDTSRGIFTLPKGISIFGYKGQLTLEEDIICSKAEADASAGSSGTHFIIINYKKEVRYVKLGDNIVLRNDEILLTQCRWGEALYMVNASKYKLNGQLINCINTQGSRTLYYATHVYGTPTINIETGKITILAGARFLVGGKDITFEESIELSNTMGGGTGYLLVDPSNKEVRLQNATSSSIGLNEYIICLFRFGTGVLAGTIESYSLNGETIDFLNFTSKKAASSIQQGTLAPCMYNPPLDLTKQQLRVLDIGNSYTDDCTHYLSQITQASGIDVSDMCLYKAVRGGASFRNWHNVYYDSDTASYSVVKVLGGLTANIEGTAAAGNGERFRNTLINNKWDLIIIHQVSTYAPYFDRWEENNDAGYLSKLIRVIRKHQPQATIGFLLVHSYWSGYSSNTEKSSRERWKLIADSVMRLRAKYGIDFVIPYGTAIQNLRASSLNNGYDLTADGTHCADGIADYTAACCYFQSLLTPRYGVSILGNSCRIPNVAESNYPGIPVTDENASICQRAAFMATYDWYTVHNPDEITI